VMNARRFLATAIAILCASKVGAQETRLTLIRDDATRDRVRVFIEAAQKRGTPIEPLIARALEGQAFKADAKVIEKALAVLETRMRRAQKLLGQRASVDELAAVADAIGNDVPEDAIRRIRARVPAHRSVTVEIGVLTELVAKGVSPKQAAKWVEDLIARGATGVQLTELNAAVEQDVALGVAPIEALLVRGRGVMSLLPPAAGTALAQPSIRP
jgi:hypothetical protein